MLLQFKVPVRYSIVSHSRQYIDGLTLYLLKVSRIPGWTLVREERIFWAQPVQQTPSPVQFVSVPQFLPQPLGSPVIPGFVLRPHPGHPQLGTSVGGSVTSNAS